MLGLLGGILGLRGVGFQKAGVSGVGLRQVPSRIKKLG